MKLCVLIAGPEVRFLCCLFVFIIGSSVQAAELYKWVDDEGKVHFSDKPPPKDQAREVEQQKVELQNVDSSFDTVLDATRIHESGKSLAPKPTQQSAAKRSRQQQCSRTATRLDRISGRVVFYDDQGREVIVTESERMAEERELRDWLAANC